MGLRADLAEGSGTVRRGTSALLQSVSDGMNEDEKGRDAAPAPLVPPAPKTSENRLRQSAKRLWLMARLDGADVTVNTQLAPSQAGHVFVTPVGGGRAEAVDAERLTLRGLVSEVGCQSD
jgi:ParB family chromosome partitioning protein